MFPMAQNSCFSLCLDKIQQKDVCLILTVVVGIIAQ